MPKQRGPYKRYVYDSTVEKPESTTNYHKRRYNISNVNQCIETIQSAHDQGWIECFILAETHPIVNACRGI